MGDWDDDDFEVDVEQIKEKKVHIIGDIEEPVAEHSVEKHQPPKPKSKAKMKSPLNTMSYDLGRELTEEEKQEMQRKSDLGFACDLLGTSSDGESYADISTVEEFRAMGEKVGKFLATRHKASCYVDMIATLMKVLVNDLDASKVRSLSATLKQIAEEKTVEEKMIKKQASSAKPSMKVSQKSNAKSNKNIYDDYDYGGGKEYDDYDEYDDFM